MAVSYTSLEAMLRIIRNRTKVMSNDAMIVDELNVSMDRAFKRFSSVITNVQITFETENTFAVETQTFDLAAAITTLGGEFYEHVTFFIMDVNQNKYVPVLFMNLNDPRFVEREQMTAQVLTPVYAAAVNFGSVRFAPALPAGTQWRSDWMGKPPKFSLATNCVTSLPDPIVGPVLDDATASIFNTLDDTREASYRMQYEANILSGIHALGRRQNQTPQPTTPYPRRSTGYYGTTGG